MNPNIVILGVPRSGTSITASMIRALGWNYAPDSNWGGESKALLAIHHSMIDRDKRAYVAERFDERAAREVLRDLKAPWVLKNPTWSFTLPLWEPLLREASGDRPLVLIWSTRDPSKVEASWRRRTGLPAAGSQVRPDGTIAGKRSDITIPEFYAQAQRTFENWDGVKIRVDLADLKKAAALFDTSWYRAIKRRFRTWRGFTVARAKARLGAIIRRG